MIPYEDLVAALQAWRVKQGLPVGELNTVSLTPAMATSFGGARSAPPTPPPRSTGAAPPPADEMIVDDAAMLEDHYDNEGDDYAMSFQQHQEEGEATSLGSPPQRSSDNYGDGRTSVDPEPTAGKSKKRGNYDW